MTSSIFLSLVYLKSQVFRARAFLLGAFEQLDIFLVTTEAPFS
jgi:hypothetical protein